MERCIQTIKEQLIKYLSNDSLIIDIQGITADNTIENERNYFINIAPNNILKIINKKKPHNIILISQGDKSNGDKMGYTGIGATLAELYKLLLSNDYNVKIFIIESKKSSKKILEDLLDITDLSICQGHYNEYNNIDYLLWLKTIELNYPNIHKWERWGRLDRINNAIKQLLANSISDLTFILNNNNLCLTKLSSHIIKNKSKDNILII